ncbi:hypothetical protein ACRRTK_021201 [Alexandromys fortis]
MTVQNNPMADEAEDSRYSLMLNNCDEIDKLMRRGVTCAFKNKGQTAALVWSQKDGIYSPTLVILRTNYLATFVKMTPLENKFSVWSRARLISVYYFESENGWWPHVRSNAECLSAYIKEVSETLATPHWGSLLPFGQLISKFGGSDASRCLASLPVQAALPGSAMTALLSIADASKSMQVPTLRREVPTSYAWKPDFIENNRMESCGNRRAEHREI